MTDIFTELLPKLRLYYEQTHDSDVVGKFVGAAPGTVQDWIKAKQPAKGERLIKLWYFLEAAGFQFSEIDDIPKFNRYLGHIFSFGLISLDEAMQICGVKNPQTALQALRGQPPMHPAYSTEELHALYDDGLKDAQALLQNRLKQLQTITRDPPVAPKVPMHEQTQTEDAPVVSLPTRGNANIMTAATLLSAALPLVRQLNSERCSPEDRSHLRDLMGDGGIFELSNHLNALCSERARNQMRGR